MRSSIMTKNLQFTLNFRFLRSLLFIFEINVGTVTFFFLKS